mmetsp:Transcript_24885/g.54364  ORF Transcript_24885/g.54364 Transcript_24885/m.54364 type:complete len:145 (+) Transcript_24885:251-685(+)
MGDAGPASSRRFVEEEDASLCKFGPDFQDADCLFNADVAIILENKIQVSQQKGIQPKSAFLKAYEYVNRVKQFTDKESSIRARQELEKYPKLNSFEGVQLGNLFPEDAEEARALVPSLQLDGRGMDTDRLNELLQALADCKQFT